jgi:hypothetical protein
MAGGDILLGMDDVGVMVEDTRLGMIIFQETETNPESTIALSAAGSARLIGVDGLDLYGSLELKYNNTGMNINETFMLPDPNNPGTTTSFNVNFQDNVEIGLAGTAGIRVYEGDQTFFSLEGGFAFNMISHDDGSSQINIGAAGIEAFMGVGPAKIDGEINPDAMGVMVENGQLAVVLFDDSGYALDISGGAALLGIPELSLSGTLGVKLNQTGRNINESILVPLPDGSTKELTITMPASLDEPMFQGTVDLNIADMFTLSGGFAFMQDTQGDTTKIIIGAASVEAFIGVTNNDGSRFGVVANVDQMGVVLYNTPQGSSYALQGTGGAA